jgi:Prolyl oligopeptidase family.
MKKFTLAILTLLLFSTFTACGGNNLPAEYIAEHIILNAGTEFELQGMLTIPDSVTEKVPAVILVHGSGPANMDEAVHSYAPFKDIAEYLSANGIAVLRYDKSTYTHGVKMAENIAELTVKEETINDAIAAAELLRNDERIDSEKIYLLGHSLGGMLAPRIDAEGGNFAGIILWAGSPRTFGEIWLDQAEAELLTLPEDQHELGRNQIADAKQIFENIKNISDDQAKQAYLLGATLYYYKEMDAHPTENYLRDITKPILIMQGGKDFQVYADKDYTEYQRILDGKSNATFKLYPELNHFFITSTKGTVDEYKVRDNVSAEVLKDITDWIKLN